MHLTKTLISDTPLPPLDPPFDTIALPGLIGWAVLNIGMAFKQHQNLGYVSFSMVLVVLYQGLYVWDALFNERAILTTMDITTDGFGYMLAFGDLAWVPFIYSLQARFLVEDDPELSSAALVLISLVHFFGLFVFRSSNSEKDRFRRNPDAPECTHLSFMQTQRGTKVTTGSLNHSLTRCPWTNLFLPLLCKSTV
jgi:delta14-sterol reductase/lamin-B receptor